LLATIGVAGTITLAAAAPNVAGMFARKITDLSRMRTRTKSAATKLAKKGLVRFVEREGHDVLEITPAGRRLLELELAKKDIGRPRKWDGRYRVVAFDISERFKLQRDALRRSMLSLGFLRLQNSMWVFPHDCEELIVLIKSELHLGKNVIYMIVDEIDNDDWIRRHFKLPPRQ